MLECPVQVDEIYNGCFCFFEWNDANKVGNWTFEENWLQLVEPPWVGFVSVAGDNTVHVEHDRRINELYVGPNRWDTTRLVIDEDLTIGIYLFLFFCELFLDKIKYFLHSKLKIKNYNK